MGSELFYPVVGALITWGAIGIVVALAMKYAGKPKPLSYSTIIIIAAFGVMLTLAVGL